ncbi:MAG: 1-acyl-sn-glycerol-3-phosphate acyltransferase [Myxococcales bacterium]|nr:1-acyl-sn-glycerol-3-phosphate acyltransferase [Myxococcales bacterium]
MSASYRSAVTVVRLLVRAFFRRVEVSGLENVPSSGGGLIVAAHPNGLVDPGLILAFFPRPVAFGARHGLFRLPLLGWVMRGAGAVPIYRAVDAKAGGGDRRAQNQRSLTALAQAISGGAFAALFPEGISHDAPRLMELKTGAARLYYQARAECPDKRPVIIPVGLHYDDKRAFRSYALVEFHPPLELSAELDIAPPPDESDDVVKERARALTDEIETRLSDIVHPTETWELHHLMHRARKLVRAERAHRAAADPGRPDMQEKVLGFARIWSGYNTRLASHPDEVATVLGRLRSYDLTLRALAVEDHDLDLDPRLASPWLGFLLFLQLATVYLVLPPLLIVGYLVNLPVALLLIGVSKLTSRAYKDEATVKLLLGALLFPLAWISVGVLAARGNALLGVALPGVPDVPVLAGISMGLLACVGGAAGMRYLRVARETARAVRVRLFRRWRRREVERLRVERSALFDAIISFSVGLELPGRVDSKGRVVREPSADA